MNCRCVLAAFFLFLPTLVLAEFIGGDKATGDVVGTDPIKITWSLVEYKKCTTWHRVDASNVASLVRHVLRVDVNPNWTRETVAWKNGSTVTPMLNNYPSGVLDSDHVNNYFAPTYTVGMVFPGPYKVRVYCNGAANMGVEPEPYDIPIASNTTQAGLRYCMREPAVPPALTTSVPIQWPSSEILEGGTFRVVVEVERHWWELDSIVTEPPDPNNPSRNVRTLTWTEKKQTFYQRCNLDLSKLVGGDTSVDTRKTYGDPTVAGAIPGDPNQPGINANFAPWLFKGGLFLGNMPPNTNDQSGTARVQLYFDAGGSGTHLGSIVSIYPVDWVDRSGYKSHFDVGVFAPTHADPNSITTETTARWSNRWLMTLGTPVSTMSIDFPRTGVDDDYECAVVPDVPTFGPGLVLALTNEPTEPNLGDTSWFYISSREWQATKIKPVGYLGFYIPADSRPRIWRLGLTSTTSWNTAAVNAI